MSDNGLKFTCNISDLMGPAGYHTIADQGSCYPYSMKWSIAVIIVLILCVT